MPDEPSDAQRAIVRPPWRGMVLPRNRVTVAFPFSKIEMNGSDDRAGDLAALVVDLIDALAAVAPDAALAPLRARAVALAAD
jgi:hypothetical protein